MIFTLFNILLGLFFLIISADRLVIGASALARHTGISPLMVGLTVVAFGTSAPEFVVTLVASLENNASLAVGAAVGSNIANIALILGICALIRPIPVEKSLIVQQLPVLIGISVTVAAALLYWGLHFKTGILLSVLCLAYFLFLLYLSRGAAERKCISDQENLPPFIGKYLAVGYLLFGLIVLPFSAAHFIAHITVFAQAMGLSDLVIGLSVVAIGTSLPELSASIAGTLRKEEGIAVGNVIGSNILNLTLVLLPPTFLSTAPLAGLLFSRDIPIMLILTVLLFLVCFSNKRQGLITRIEGGVLLLFFIGYLVFILS